MDTYRPKSVIYSHESDWSPIKFMAVSFVTQPTFNPLFTEPKKLRKHIKCIKKLV